MNKIMLLLILVAITLLPHISASPFDDCFRTYCQSGYVLCSDALCPKVVSGCAGNCLDIYTVNPSPCTSACSLLASDEACVKPYAGDFASCMGGCWRAEKHTDCGYACLNAMKRQESECQAGAQPPSGGVDTQCPAGSSYSSASYSSSDCHARAKGGFCCCGEGYRLNYPGNACVPCGDGKCEYWDGENCKTCGEDCGCGELMCNPEAPNANLSGCHGTDPVITYIAGEVSIIQEDGTVVRPVIGDPVFDGEKVTLHKSGAGPALVEIQWPDGKMARVMLGKDITDDSFTVKRHRQMTEHFEESEAADIIESSRPIRLLVWAYKLAKGASTAVAQTVLYISWPNSAGDGTTYVKLNSELFIEPQEDGSVVVGSVEGAPEIFYKNVSVVVQAGLYSKVGPDGAPSQPQPYDASKIDRWWEKYKPGGDNTLVILLVIVIAAALLAIFKLKKKRVLKK